VDRIRAVIADDEPLARRGIGQLLALHADIWIVGETRNGRETVRALRELKPDLLFLDVQMPEMDGFDVLREVGATNMSAVIFVTAHDEFALRAFEANALDYLLKPIEEARFNQALERMRARLQTARAADLSRRLSALLAAQENERAKQRLIVRTSSGDLLLDTTEIDWIEADNYYAAIHIRDARHLIRESLASLEERLDDKRFVRVHRSVMVNIDRVREIRRKDADVTLILDGGVKLPVSRRRSDHVSKLLREAVRSFLPTDR
jgi:two-component system LytT family response regulator